MKQAILIITLSIAFASLGYAEEKADSLAKTMENLAKDLADIQEDIYQTHEEEIKIDGFTAKWMRNFNNNEVMATAPDVKIHAGASEQAEVIETSKKGMRYRTISQSDGWYSIYLPKSKGEYTSGWVNQKYVAPVIQTPIIPVSANKPKPSGLQQKLMRKVLALKETYKNNPHIRVKGFTIEISVPPSVSIDFDFK